MSELGLALLVMVGAGVVLTGLPAFAMLILGAGIGALAGVLGGAFEPHLLSALPNRLVALLEHDLLQALPLYVLMGILLDRMGVAEALLKSIARPLPAGPASQMVAGMTLGALLGPMNGSVGASVLALSRALAPRLRDAGVPEPTRYAVVAVASTFGIVIPPSLVLILLGDAMLNAHTLAINATGRADRVVNTQDIFHGAFAPAALLVVLCIAVAWRRGRAVPTAAGPDGACAAAEPPRRAEAALAGLSVALLGVLLGGVAVGRLYAVEAAATGAFALLLGGFASGRLGRHNLRAALADTLATTGALFAPLLAATTFTLVLRLLGTDKLIEAWITSLPGGPRVAVAVVLAAIAISGLVLDAFEIVFVVVPILVPPLLMRVPDAAWVAVLVLLTLQASFLFPPVGYALMMTRSTLGGGVRLAGVVRALAPFLAIQLLVLGLVLAFPALVHPGRAGAAGTSGAAPLSREEVDLKFRQLRPPSAPDGLPNFGGTGGTRR